MVTGSKREILPYEYIELRRCLDFGLLRRSIPVRFRPKMMREWDFDLLGCTTRGYKTMDHRFIPPQLCNRPSFYTPPPRCATPTSYDFDLYWYPQTMRFAPQGTGGIERRLAHAPYSGDSQNSWSSPQGLQRRSTKNETFFDFVSVVAYRIKKFDLKKKLELTEGTFWTTFLKYHDPHSIGKPMQIAISMS